MELRQVRLFQVIELLERLELQTDLTLLANVTAATPHPLLALHQQMHLSM